MGCTFKPFQEAEQEGFSETCRKHNLSPTMVSMWRKKYLAKGAEGLKPSYRQVDPQLRANECLQDFSGYLQTDGYAVYDDLDKRANITLLHCMAHARRMFDQALENDKSRAGYVLTEMQKLYAVEQVGRDKSLS